MKTNNIVLLINALIVLAFNSCTVENRHHLSGNHINWKWRTSKLMEQKSGMSSAITSSIDNSYAETQGASSFQNDSNFQNNSDTIYLISGKKLIASVFQVEKEDVLVKKNSSHSSRKKRIHKTEISYIKNSKGELIEFPFYKVSENALIDTANSEKNLDLLVFKSGKKILVHNIKTDSSKITYQTTKVDQMVWSKKINKVAFVIDKNGIKQNFTPQQIDYDKTIKKYYDQKKWLTPILITLTAIIVIGLILLLLSSINLNGGSSFF